MTKKLFSILLASAMAFSFVACSDDDGLPTCDSTDEVCKCQCYTKCLKNAGSDLADALACPGKCMDGQLVTDDYCEEILSSN